MRTTRPSKPGEQAGGSGTSTSCRPAAPGQGVGAASKKRTPSRATAPEKSSAHCDVQRHARRSDVARHTAEQSVDRVRRAQHLYQVLRHGRRNARFYTHVIKSFAALSERHSRGRLF
ncbi:hypothetical protein MRX96_013039 [Rhipicephalus microplus]